MDEKQLRILSNAKKLIINGHCRFQIRSDRDYIEDLIMIGITEEYAWKVILSLSNRDYVFDYRPFYNKTGNALVFKRLINGYAVYIKIKIECNYDIGEEVVCLSFHIDNMK